jgi:protein phosphatase
MAKPDVQPACPYFVRTDQNQRENNEDSFLVFSLQPDVGSPPLVLLAVADGMGGFAHGEDVSSEALRKISHALFECWVVGRRLNHSAPCTALPDVADLSAGLMEAIREANAHVRRMVEKGGWGKSGSTVVAAAIAGDALVAANLGDSPLFHYEARTTTLHKVTEDHTVAGVLLQAGLITPEMARFHEGRSRLEFYIGGANLPRQDPVQVRHLHAGDILLLCSDGVSGPLREEEIRAVLGSPHRNLEQMAEQLLELSRATGETDNQTLILWQQPGDPPAALTVRLTAEQVAAALAETQPAEPGQEKEGPR